MGFLEELFGDLAKVVDESDSCILLERIVDAGKKNDLLLTLYVPSQERNLLVNINVSFVEQMMEDIDCIHS